MKYYLFKADAYFIVESSVSFKDMCTALRSKDLGKLRCDKELKDILEAVLAQEKFGATWITV